MMHLDLRNTKSVVILAILVILTGCSQSSNPVTVPTKNTSSNKLLSSWCKVEVFGEVQSIKPILTKLGVIIANSVENSISGVLPIKCDKARKSLSLTVNENFEITLTDIPMLSGIISIKSDTAKQILDSDNESIESLRKFANQFSTARLYASTDMLNFEIITNYPVFDANGKFLDDDKISILIRDISILLADAANAELSSIEVNASA
jgi:hypothetical protein